MKKPAFLVVLAICSSLCLAAPQELAMNGGFEAGSSGKPDNWASRGSGGYATWKNDSTWGKWGTWYINAGASSGSGQYQEWVQNIAVVPGTSCTFSAQARTENWGNPTAYMQIDWKNAAGTTIGSTQKTLFSGSQNNSWVLYSTGAIAVPGGAASGDFILHGGYNGTALFDQISVSGETINTDFNGDYIVDFGDFALLANSWLQSSAVYDLTGDGQVDFSDLGVFAGDWLAITSPPFEGPLLTINDALRYQTMDGFGGSVTESSANLISSLNSDEQQSVLEDLFDPNTGIGLSYLRQPMGASDFRTSNYTYDEIPVSVTADYDLTSFSIDRETTNIIPVLLEALAISPDIEIMGTPWSPPTWMKTVRTFNGSSGGSNVTLKNDDNVYQALANYFVKYIQAYAQWGINIDAITLQNEPRNATTASPGLYMSSTDQIRLIKQVGPAFAANGIATKIVTYDHNWDNTSYVTAVYNDSVARSYLDGSAWHDYFGNVSTQNTIHTARPEKNIYFTESSDGDWNNSGFSADLLRNANLVVDVTRNWAKTVVKWNLALDQANGPKTTGGCDTCYGFVTINSATHAVSQRPQYYAIGQASKFVRPGAVRIDSTQSPGAGIKNVAFLNLDGSIVCFAVNPDSNPHNLKIVWNTLSFIYTLPAASVSTFEWKPNSIAVDVWITTGDQAKLLQKQRGAFFQ